MDVGKNENLERISEHLKSWEYLKKDVENSLKVKIKRTIFSWFSLVITISVILNVTVMIFVIGTGMRANKEVVKAHLDNSKTFFSSMNSKFDRIDNKFDIERKEMSRKMDSIYNRIDKKLEKERTEIDRKMDSIMQSAVSSNFSSAEEINTNP